MVVQRYYESIEVIKKEKLMAVRLLKPHRVLSTCRVGGGFTEACDYVINHQACEPAGHVDTDLHEIATLSPEKYRERIALRHGFAPEKIVMMTTAANMNNAAFSVQRFEEVEVVAIVTAGVEGNAACAADTAAYTQRQGGHQRVGTIVTMAFTNLEMTNSAMLVASTVMTEAKTAVLRDLHVKSRQSHRIATGTGTDQFALACMMGSDCVLTDANKHTKAGELFGRAVEDATRKALNLQNGMSADTRRSCLVFFSRLGCDEAHMKELVKVYLNVAQKDLFDNNFLSVNHDPMVVASAAGFVHTAELIGTGVLPADHRVELLTHEAARLAASVAGRITLEEPAYSQLAQTGAATQEDPCRLACCAIALGFQEKWKGLFSCS